MSFPTVNQTATVATLTTGGVSLYSIIRGVQLLNTKPRSVPQLVAFCALSVLSTTGSVGCATAWLRSGEGDTAGQYLKNAAHDSAVAAGAFVSTVGPLLLKAVVDGVASGVRDRVYEGVYDGLGGKNNSKKPDSSD